LSETEFKNNGLISLAEKISGQHSLQSVAWILPVACSQVCSQNWEQKAEQKYLKYVKFGQKRSTFKVY
jgi:hypothetical protein